MKPLEEYIARYSSAIVTGGSSGIGQAFITALSHCSIGLRICNISRTEATFPEGLQAGQNLRADLSDIEDVARVSNDVERWLSEDSRGGRILLLNNAGFGSYGPFPEPDLDHHLSMVQLNVAAPVALTGHLLPLLRERGGAIINIASTAAFQPTPYMATYGATKSFVLNWSLALNEDLRGTGVTALCVCPGPTESQFFRRAGFDEPPLNTGFGMKADAVAEQSLKALAKGRSLFVPGASNRALSSLSPLLPKRLQAPLTRRVLKKMRIDRKEREAAGE